MSRKILTTHLKEGKENNKVAEYEVGQRVSFRLPTPNPDDGWSCHHGVITECNGFGLYRIHNEDEPKGSWLRNVAAPSDWIDRVEEETLPKNNPNVSFRRKVHEV